MHCEYCDVEVANYPATGICPCCGAKLPPRPVIQQVEQPMCIPVQPIHPSATAHICPKCSSTQVTTTTRGFSWGLALLGFCLFSIFGLPLGFCGRNNPRYQCRACGKKWKP